MKPPLHVDVRRAEEYHLGHIPGAYNVDLENDAEFIAKVTALAEAHEVILYCLSGFRSQYAQSLLATKHGVVVGHLNGGLSTYIGPLE